MPRHRAVVSTAVHHGSWIVLHDRHVKDRAIGVPQRFEPQSDTRNSLSDEVQGAQT